MPRATVPRPLLRSLRWRHFNWHLWVGLAIWAGVVLVFISYQYSSSRHRILHTDSYTENNFQAYALANKASEMVKDAVMLLIGGFLLALVGGLLRTPLLRALSHKTRTPNELVWLSLLLFELSVFLLALMPWPLAYNTFNWDIIQRQFLILFVGSLPWLFTTGVASHRLAIALRLPPYPPCPLR